MAVEGLLGGCRLFDGLDDYVELPEESAYDFTTALTVEAWIRADMFDAYFEAIVTKGDDAWRLHRENTTRSVGFGSDTNDGIDDNLGGAVLVDENHWHYVAIVYGNAEKRIYVDGMPDGRPMPYLGPIKTTDSVVMFGMNAQQPGREFEGEMDEVRISNVARNRSWIRMQHQSMTDQVLEYGTESHLPVILRAF